MAVDMLVDSGKLEACCTAEAAAIIAKGGGAAPLAYDFANNKGFANAIAAIPTGGSPYPDEYVTDGLMVWYDAINNTRSGHDASAAIWEDLSGNGYDLKPLNTSPMVVGDNFMYFSGAQLQTDARPDVSEIKCVEIIVQKNPQTGTRFIVGVANARQGTICSKLTGVHLVASTGVGDSLVSPYEDDELHSLSAFLSGVVLVDTEWKPRDVSYESWSNNINITMGKYHTGNQYNFNGYICAYRLYNRMLTIDECRQNYAQDKKRFGINGGGFGLTELFTALPALPTGTSKTISVSSAQLATASAETIAIATGKGWTVA